MPTLEENNGMGTGTRRYSIRVDGLPPKKDGARSMWGKSNESQRLGRLRERIIEVFGNEPPLERDISIVLDVHVGHSNSRQTGDLDNFITGICDGLQAADHRVALDPFWETVDPDIYPSRCIGIEDDAYVMEIRSRKHEDESGELWYELTLSGK